MTMDSLGSVTPLGSSIGSELGEIAFQATIESLGPRPN
jgi:hypothetical protein